MNPEELVRRVLHAQAERVEIAPDALGSIRSRIDRRTRRRRTMTMSLTSVATGAAATVAAVAVGVASCGAPQPAPTLPPAGGMSPGPGPATSPATPPAPHVGVRLPVYYLATISVGDAPARIVLYREFHAVTLPEDTLDARIAGAVAEMLDAAPLDPDYTTGWPATAAVRGAKVEGDVAIVDLSGAARNSVGAEAAQRAVQQLVWTVTAAAADYGTQLRGIRLHLDGAELAELWGHVGVEGVLSRGLALENQAPVYLISPQQGDTVASTFTVHIDGAVFEATAQLLARDLAGEVVYEDSVTLDNGAPARGEAFVEITLPPGHYTLEAFFYSARDGSVQGLDDHEIIVG